MGFHKRFCLLDLLMLTDAASKASCTTCCVQARWSPSAREHRQLRSQQRGGSVNEHTATAHGGGSSSFEDLDECSVVTVVRHGGGSGDTKCRGCESCERNWGKHVDLKILGRVLAGNLDIRALETVLIPLDEMLSPTGDMILQSAAPADALSLPTLPIRLIIDVLS
jgi:hypothetical protein